jgi:hypothetical protein
MDITIRDSGADPFVVVLEQSGEEDGFPDMIWLDITQVPDVIDALCKFRDRVVARESTKP